MTTPIPHYAQLKTLRSGYKEHPIDMSSPLHEEPCVEIAEYGISGKNHYYAAYNPPYYHRVPGSIPNLLVRKSVAERLSQVNAYLKKRGLMLFVFDGWRPQVVQRYMRETWAPEKLRSCFPHWDDARVQQEAGKYWSDGAPSEGLINMSAPPPHSTGGAVDVSICETSGGLLDMGTIFDDMSSHAHVDAIERMFDPGADQKELLLTHEFVIGNRRLLYHLMVDAGFAPNPNEWWHYSWGDQTWARMESSRTGKIVPAQYSATNPLCLP